MESPLASLLWRSLRLYQLFGANTNVGKTVFATLLGRTAKRLWPDESVTYLKPVSTGPSHEADHCHIRRFAPGLGYQTLFQYDAPVSPHKAARTSAKPMPSDDDFLSQCREFAAKCAARPGKGWLFLETAGGPHSPSISGRTQADVYIPLRAPVVLVADPGLGGISQTISAFESLMLRGYQVESVILFKNDLYENDSYLGDYFQKYHRIPVTSVAGPPRKGDEARLDSEAMMEYYDRADCQKAACRILEHLKLRHSRRIASLEALPARAHRHIWYPFTQQSLLGPGDIMAIDSAHGDCFQSLSARAAADAGSEMPLLQSSFDGSASWWTQGLGHSNPRLTLAAASAAGRYGHVMFAGAIHEPAMALAEALLRAVDNPRQSRVFYSDNGSTGNEVALKMALRAVRLRHKPDARQRLGVIGIKGGYHGDTLGAMDATEPSAFSEKVEWYESRGYWFDSPTVLCANGRWSVSGGGSELGDAKWFPSLEDIFDMEARERREEHKPYEEHIIETLDRLGQQERRFGAVMLEPVVMGAGGMKLVDPLFQQTLVNVIRRRPRLLGAYHPPTTGPQDWSGLPVIFDEVLTGLYRLGRATTSSFLGVVPDISVHAKVLTGGLLPLCVTMASEDIFSAFLGDKTDALLHGHSYTAHPVGCQVALESVRELQAMEKRGAWDWAKTGWTRSEKPSVWSVWPRDFVESLSRQSRVTGAWALGTILAIHIHDSKGPGYQSREAAGLCEALRRQQDGSGVRGPWNVHARALGNVFYLMASQSTAEGNVRRLAELVEQSLAS